MSFRTSLPRHAAPSIRRAAAAAAVLLTLAGPARADDIQQAKTLFEQGISDIDGGRLDRACPAIEQSFRLDPRPGTLFTLAECEAQRGHIATAVGRYTEYLALYKNFTPKKQSEQKGRADTSAAQIAALTPHVPMLTLRLPPGAGDDVEVKRDGQVLPALSLGTALSVDPGEHVITTQVPGGPLIEHRIDLKKDDRKELRLTLQREAAPPDGPVPPPLVTASPTATSRNTPLPAGAAPPAVAPPPAARAHVIGAVAAGAVGLAGLLVGSVTGGLALDRKSIVDRDCTRTGAGYDCATTAGVDAGQSLKALGAVSTATFVVGLAGFGTAAVLLLTMPAPRPASGAPARPTPVASALTLSLTLQGATLQGTF